jgi:hypothetical protein
MGSLLEQAKNGLDANAVLLAIERGSGSSRAAPTSPHVDFTTRSAAPSGDTEHPGVSGVE